MRPWVALLLSAALLPGCVQTTTPANQQDASNLPRVYLDSQYLLSGPFGDKQAINSFSQLVQHHARHRVVANRQFELPNKPANEILKVYDVSLPSHCGGHVFTLVEGDELLMLNYHFPRTADQTIEIRDYIVAPDPFASAGLWGPYDHTLDSVCRMVLVSSDEGNHASLGLLDGNYAVGWMTPLSSRRQDYLGKQYQAAINDVRNCDAAQLAAHVSGSSNTVVKRAPAAQAPRASAAKQTVEENTGPATARLADATGYYTVADGDTLFSIAEQFFGDRDLWDEIYYNNKGLIDNPNALEAGLKLVIPQ